MAGPRPGPDNGFYDRAAGTWWDEASLLHALHPRANPARLGYVMDRLERLLGPGSGGRVLDLGCGGGFLCEELARRGLEVCGVDPSGPSVEVARAHARAAGLAVDYRVGAGERLPLEDDSVDAVCCLDVLEHVSSLEQVVAEVARVLRPGGVFVYDTVNRTWRSWLVMVYLLQDLSWTRLASERPHDWRLFVRPGELHRALARHGLSNQETVGMGPSASLPRLLGLLRRCKLGEITPAEALRLSAVRLGPDTSVSYLGYALKDHTAR